VSERIQPLADNALNDGFDPTTGPGFDPSSVDWDQYEDEQPWPGEYVGKHRA